MTKRPKGREYRGLYARGEVIWISYTDGGKRTLISAGTDDWDRAAKRRDDAIHGKHRSMTFADATRKALADMAACGVAETTSSDRIRLLRDEGRIIEHLGSLTLDQVDVAALRRWHDAAISQRGRSFKTGANQIDAIEMVLRWARGRGHLARGCKPVQELREDLLYARRTKSAHAKQDEARRYAKDAVLTPEEVGRLVAAAQEESLEATVITMLAVECGLRLGEIVGLKWGDIEWGAHHSDPCRRLILRHTRSRGDKTSPLKSGFQREPHISTRLQHALRKLKRSRFEPGAEADVVQQKYSRLYTHTMRRVLERAGLPKRTFQNMRATASTLLKQWGVAEEYVRYAIGHEDKAVAAKHYDALDFSKYKTAEQLNPEVETPMDLFARLCVPTADCYKIATDTKRILKSS